MCSGPNSQLWPPAVTALLFQLCLYYVISVVALKKRERRAHREPGLETTCCNLQKNSWVSEGLQRPCSKGSAAQGIAQSLAPGPSRAAQGM